MLNVILRCVFVLNVIMLSVVAPFLFGLACGGRREMGQKQQI
jgi:hypothetical protein